MQKNKIMKKWYFFIVTFLTLNFVQAQSPPDLDTDIAWSGGYATVSDIATAFNAGRRGEETQKKPYDQYLRQPHNALTSNVGCHVHQ